MEKLSSLFICPIKLVNVEVIEILSILAPVIIENYCVLHWVPFPLNLHVWRGKSCP